MSYGHSDNGPLRNIVKVNGFSLAKEKGNHERLVRSVVLSCGHRNLQRGHTIKGREVFPQRCRCGTCARLELIKKLDIDEGVKNVPEDNCDDEGNVESNETEIPRDSSRS